MAQRLSKILTTLFLLLGCETGGLMAQNLTDIVDLALQNDPNLKKMEAEKLADAESKDQSLARFFPTLSASLSTTKVNQTNTKSNVIAVPFQNYWNNVASINFTQPIFHWDHWVQLSQSDNIIAQAEADYAAETQNLLLKTATAYFEVLYARDNLSFALSEKSAIARQLEQANQRFEVGIAPITDMNEAQAAFDLAKANEIDAANLLDDNNDALKEIIGEQELVLELLRDTIPLVKPQPDDLNAWSEKAELNSYAVIAAFNQVEVTRKDIEIQFNGHLPTLDLVAGFQQTDNTGRFGVRGDNKSIGLQLNVPLFQGGSVNSKTRQAEFKYQAAQENLNAVKRQVKRQIKEAYRGVLTHIGRVEAFKTAVTSAEVSLDAAQAGLEVGTRTMVEVLAEQSLLFKARRDYARARYDYLINSIKLKQLASNLTRDDLDQISHLLLANGKHEENPMAKPDR